MAKCAAKGEPWSQTVQSVFKLCVEDLSCSSDAHEALRCAMLRSVEERDFSAQETCHLLLSLPLFSCSFNFVAVCFDRSKKVFKHSVWWADSTGVHSWHIPHVKLQLSSFNLYHFIANYTTTGGRLCIKISTCSRDVASTSQVVRRRAWLNATLLCNVTWLVSRSASQITHRVQAPAKKAWLMYSTRAHNQHAKVLRMRTLNIHRKTATAMCSCYSISNCFS